VARPRELVPGNCYFTVFYYDTDLLLPYVQTLVYRRVDELEDGERTWVFEEGDDSILCGFRDDQLYQVLDLDGLRRALAGLAPDHPLSAPSEAASPVGMDETVGRELRARAEAFMADPDARALTVTVLFTDDALSLQKRHDGGLGIGFFTHPRCDDEDERLLRLFAEDHVAPHVDYLADRGRTRVLEFALRFAALDDVVGLCGRVFTDIHAMREDDTLTFHMIGEESSSKEA